MAMGCPIWWWPTKVPTTSRCCSATAMGPSGRHSSSRLALIPCGSSWAASMAVGSKTWRCPTSMPTTSLSCWEGHLALAQQHRDVVGIDVGHRQVLDPTAIEAAHDDPHGINANREELCRPEGPIAVAEQHRDVVGTFVGHHQIGHPIAIEVAHGDGYRITADRKISLGER